MICKKKLKNVISVVGESGKFTTLFSLKSFIEANNQTVTTHISPSLQDIKERFYIGKKYLSHKTIKASIKTFALKCTTNSHWRSGRWRQAWFEMNPGEKEPPTDRQEVTLQVLQEWIKSH